MNQKGAKDHELGEEAFRHKRNGCKVLARRSLVMDKLPKHLVRVETQMPENEEFDLIVVGCGSAGYAAARTFHEDGGRVAMVDGAAELGGLCILRGCMPSKTLIYSAEALHFARQGDVFGFEAGSPAADLAAMQERKKKVIAEFADYRSGQIEDGRFELFRERAPSPIRTP